MAFNRARYTEKLYGLYSAYATEELRSARLTALSVDLSAIESRGKVLVASSAGGVSSSYQFFAGWTPDEAFEWISWARGHISLATAVLAVAEVPPKITSYRPQTTYCGAYG